MDTNPNQLDAAELDRLQRVLNVVLSDVRRRLVALHEATPKATRLPSNDDRLSAISREERRSKHASVPVPHVGTADVSESSTPLSRLTSDLLPRNTGGDTFTSAFTPIQPHQRPKLSVVNGTNVTNDLGSPFHATSNPNGVISDTESRAFSSRHADLRRSNALSGRTKRGAWSEEVSDVNASHSCLSRAASASRPSSISNRIRGDAKGHPLGSLFMDSLSSGSRSPARSISTIGITSLSDEHAQLREETRLLVLRLCAQLQACLDGLSKLMSSLRLCSVWLEVQESITLCNRLEAVFNSLVVASVTEHECHDRCKSWHGRYNKKLESLTQHLDIFASRLETPRSSKRLSKSLQKYLDAFERWQIKITDAHHNISLLNVPSGAFQPRARKMRETYPPLTSTPLGRGSFASPSHPVHGFSFFSSAHNPYEQSQ